MMTVMMKLTDNNFKRKVTLRASVGFGENIIELRSPLKGGLFFAIKVKRFELTGFVMKKRVEIKTIQ